MSASGWERVSNPAERAVAVLQARSNIIYAELFESRWGRDLLKELIYCGVVCLYPKVRVVVLEPPFRVRDQWELRYAKEHGENGLRKHLERLRSQRR